MKHAIAELEIALAARENNEPIHRNEGNVEQADSCAVAAAEFRQAIAVLKAAAGGPVWPEPEAPPLEDWMPFDRFVQWGIEQEVPLIHGMPWSFTFHGHPVSHESDQHYIVSQGNGEHLNFRQGERIRVNCMGDVEIASDPPITPVHETPEVEALLEMSVRVKCLKDQLDIQAEHGNWDYDPYMHGLFNGLELAHATVTGRPLRSRKAPAQWGCDKQVLPELKPSPEMATLATEIAPPDPGEVTRVLQWCLDLQKHGGIVPLSE